MNTMNVFSGLKVYPDGWTLIDSRKFNSEELAMVGATCEVVQGDYGLSAKFTLVNGSGHIYMPMSRDSVSTEGSILKVADLYLLTLQRGEEIINRIMD